MFDDSYLKQLCKEEGMEIEAQQLLNRSARVLSPGLFCSAIF